MKYATARAFRTALEQRIKGVHMRSGLPLPRLRKLVAFDRLLARLIEADPKGWVLKGGVALNLRWKDHARTTSDLDLARGDSEEKATEHLIEASQLDLGDFFVFSVERTGSLDTMTTGGAVRYRVMAELDGRRFEQIVVDVGFGDPLVPDAETIEGIDILAFAEIEPVRVPTVALEQHIAEKVHAYTRTYGGGESTRVKDLVDMVLAGHYGSPDADELRAALEAIFVARASHRLPVELPAPPTSWEASYEQLAVDVSLPDDCNSLESGYARASKFLGPILGDMVPRGARWNPATQTWVT